MNTMTPRNPDFEARIRESFTRQPFMMLVGAELTAVAPGTATIEIPHRKDLTQQHGLFHGGLVGAVADNAGGYSSFTLLDANDSLLTVEYKVNLMAPAKGERLIAHGKVLRSGRQLIISEARVFVVREGEEKLCATMIGTFMTMAGFSDHALERHSS